MKHVYHQKSHFKACLIINISTMMTMITHHMSLIVFTGWFSWFILHVWCTIPCRCFRVENLRNVFLKTYYLDPCHLYATYVSTWMANVELEHLTDKDLYLFIEKGVGGAISGIRKKLIWRNSLYTWCTYIDGYNLYMDGVCDNLVFTLNIQRHGYILKVGLRYRLELHVLQIVILSQTALRIYKPW